MGKLLEIDRKLERNLQGSDRVPLGKILPNLPVCPFIVEMLKNRGYEGNDLTVEMKRLQDGVEVIFWDEVYSKADPPWVIYIPRKDFFGRKRSKTELAATFVHELFHILDHDWPDHENYLVNLCERKAITAEVAYLRYAGKDHAWIDKYLLRTYEESGITADDIKELLEDPDAWQCAVDR